MHHEVCAQPIMVHLAAQHTTHDRTCRQVTTSMITIVYINNFFIATTLTAAIDRCTNYSTLGPQLAGTAFDESADPVALVQVYCSSRQSQHVATAVSTECTT